MIIAITNEEVLNIKVFEYEKICIADKNNLDYYENLIYILDKVSYQKDSQNKKLKLGLLRTLMQVVKIIFMNQLKYLERLKDYVFDFNEFEKHFPLNDVDLKNQLSGYKKIDKILEIFSINKLEKQIFKNELENNQLNVLNILNKNIPNKLSSEYLVNLILGHTFIKIVSKQVCSDITRNVQKSMLIRYTYRHSKLMRIINHWSDFAEYAQSQFDTTSIQDWYRCRLQHSVDRNSYPIFSRLRGMLILTNYEIIVYTGILMNKIKDEKKDLEYNYIRNHFENVEKRLDEFIQLDKIYNSPAHFTPFYVGFCASLLILHPKVLAIKKSDLSKAKKYLNKYGSEVLKNLNKNEQMFSMKRAYYETIEDMYYFYDDFNDRDIHFQRAIQMFTSDISTLFKETIGNIYQKY